MALQTIKQNIGYFTVGTVFCVDLTGDYAIKNSGPGFAQNVIATITYPAAIRFSPGASSVSKGVLNETTSKWSLGSLFANEYGEGSFCFEVIDDCLAPFNITFTVASDACECNIENNSICINANGVSCCNVQDCFGSLSIQTITDETYQHLITDDILLIDASLNTVDITLTSPASMISAGYYKSVKIKVIDLSNAVTITTPSGKIVDNTDIATATNTYSFSLTGEAIDLVTDGTNYFVF